MKKPDPYHAPAGPELDDALAGLYFGRELPEMTPAYSTDPKSARELRAQMEKLFGRTVVTGKTTTRETRFFARLEEDESTSDEVWADSYPLAVARLALLLSKRL